MPDDSLSLSRSGDSGLFGKCDKPLTVNLSDATVQHMQAQATLAGVPLGEFHRAVIEGFVWGSAEVMARASQKRQPIGIRRITEQ